MPKQLTDMKMGTLCDFLGTSKDQQIYFLQAESQFTCFFLSCPRALSEGN